MVTEAFAIVQFQDFRENYLNADMMLDNFSQKHINHS